jgi:ATP-dependent DNA helicase RecQ
MQFKASYILDVIANQILTFENSKEDKYDVDILKMRGLLKQLSAFNVDGECFTNQFEYEDLNPILSTVNNIITRGLPTKAPVNIEQELATVIGVTQRNSNKKSEINFIESNYIIEQETVFELLHIVYPKLNIERDKYIGNLANGGEWKFINETLYKLSLIHI